MKIGAWIYIPIGACIVVGYFGGFASLNGSIRYSMGLLGGLWTTWTLWRASHNVLLKNNLRYAALFIAFYAVATGFVVPKSSFLLAPFINHTSFFELTGLPIQLIRGILAILITTTLWYYYQSLRQLMLPKAEIPTTTTGREGLWISIALVFILLGGWSFTEYIGEHEEKNLQNEVLKQATILAASIHPEHINALKGTAADMKLIDYAHLEEQFTDTIDSSPHIRWVKLLLLRENKYVFITFDRNGAIDKVDAYKRYAAELSDVLNNGETFTIGPYADKSGTFLSMFVPVYDHHVNHIIAALVMDVDVKEWKLKVAEHRIMPILIALLLSIIFISFFVLRQRLIESVQVIERDEKQLEEAQKIAHSGSWNWNIQTNEISWSNEVYHIFGLDPKLVSPDYNLFIDMVHPHDREIVKHAIHDAIYNNKPYHIEHRMVLPDGTIKILYAQGKVKYDSDKEPIQLIGTTQDITERKQIEEALSENEEKLRTITYTAQDAIIMMDNEGKISFWNPAAEKIFGYTNEEAIGKDPHSLLVPEKYRDDYQKGLATFKITGNGPLIGTTRELEAIRKDGTPIAVELSLSAIKLNGAWHAVGILRDITKRKQTENKLMENEHNLSEAQRIAHVGSWDWDIIANELRWSDEIYKIFGLTPQQFGATDSSFFNTVHPDDRTAVVNAVNEAVNNHKPYNNIEHRIVHPDGTIRIVNEQGEVIYDENGKPIRMIGTVQDITEQKLYEQQLEELNASKDKFFSIVAHDLKNPFNAVLGASETLNEDIDDFDKDEIKDLSRMVYKNAKNAYTLLDNLLEWSRSQLGRISFQPQDLKLKNIISESIKAVEGQAQNKMIAITDKTEDIGVYADENLIKTVIRNLLSNAIKYTNAGGSMSISSKQINDMAEISVTDTGVGISPDAIEKIFRIETKYSTPGTEKETGTGLGLILCKEFVEKHGGRIWVESEVEKGTTFTFTLPMKRMFNYIV